METTPIPPPLPFSVVDKVTDRNQIVPTENVENDLVMLALEQWQKFNQEEANQTLYLLWRETPTIQQNGPQCGIVAITMAAQSFGLKVTSQSTYQLAVNMGITKSGELFSSTAVCDLAAKLNLTPKLLPEGLSDSRILLGHLIGGKMLLVPYDADRNHSPCLKNGHKAHWALLIGVLLRRKGNSNHRKSCCTLEQLQKNVHRIRDVTSTCDIFSIADEKDIFFLAKHGKSQRIAIWSYESLKESNLNLAEVDPKRNNPCEYVLPPDNKLTDLCGKIVVLG